MSTKSVYEHHIQAFQDQDLDAIMADYSEDSVVVTADETFRGIDEITEMFEGFFEEFSGESLFDIQDEVFEDEIAYFTYRADTPSAYYEFGTDTFIIVDDVIKYQTVSVHAHEK